MDFFRNSLADVAGDIPALVYTVSSYETHDRHADTDGFRPNFALCNTLNQINRLFNV